MKENDVGFSLKKDINVLYILCCDMDKNIEKDFRWFLDNK